MPPAASTIDTPFELAAELLDLCSALIAETSSDDPNVGGPIERQYVDFGRATADCEQLTVGWMGFGEERSAGQGAATQGRHHVYGRTTLVAFVITVARDCQPILSVNETGVPEPERIEERSRELMADAMALWSGIYRTMRAGDLFGGRCSKLYMISADPLPPQGDLAGFEMRIATDVDGILPGGS